MTNYRPFQIAAISLLASAAAAAPPSAQAAEQDNPLHAMLRAPDDLDIRAEIRLRHENMDGEFRPGLAPSEHVLSIRTRLIMEYRGSGFRIGTEIIDARAYGEADKSAINTASVNSVEPFQAYAALDLGNKDNVVKLGRFDLVLGSSRLIGRPDFSNFPQGYSGARVDWTLGKRFRATSFWTMPHQRLPDDVEGLHANRRHLDRESGDLTFWGTHGFRSGLPEKLTAETYIYRLDEKDSVRTATRNRRLWTLGARLSRKPAPGAMDMDIEAAYQTGHIRGSSAVTDVKDLPVSAWFGHFEMGGTFANSASLRLSTFVDVGSGDRAGGRYGRFDGLFGARRTDLGPGGLYGPLSWSNMISPGVRAEVKPNKRFDAYLSGRLAYLYSATDSFAATGLRDRSGKAGDRAGVQGEARARYWIKPGRLRIEAGATIFAKSRFCRSISATSDRGDTHYAYGDIVLSL